MDGLRWDMRPIYPRVPKDAILSHGVIASSILEQSGNRIPWNAVDGGELTPPCPASSPMRDDDDRWLSRYSAHSVLLGIKTADRRPEAPFRKSANLLKLDEVMI